MDRLIEPYKNIACLYDEIRPSYPDELIDDIVSAAGISQDAELLEIGPGTGKGTSLFLKRGFKIDAVELGEEMAEVFNSNFNKYPDVTLDISPFEKWNPRNNKKYDLIYCAQAFHWLDTNVKYKKCNSLLKNGGHLTPFWYLVREYSTQKSRQIIQKVEEIIKKYSQKRDIKKAKYAERISHSGVYKKEERIREIKESRLFSVIDVIEYRSDIKNSAEAFLKTKQSKPSYAYLCDCLDDRDVLVMEEEILDAVNDNGGYLETQLEYTLYIAKKIDR